MALRIRAPSEPLLKINEAYSTIIWEWSAVAGAAQEVIGYYFPTESGIGMAINFENVYPLHPMLSIFLSAYPLQCTLKTH